MSGFEVFSGVAAIFQLLEYGNRARSCVSDIVKKAKRPSQYLGELSEQVQGIIALAEVVNNEPSHISLTQPAIQKCINDSNALKEILRDLQDPLGKDVAIKLKERARLAIAWKGKEKAIEKAWKEIDRSMNILQFLVACNNNNVSSKILDAIGKSAGFSSFYPASACGGELSSTKMSLDIEMVERTSTLPPRDPRFVGQKVALAELRQKLGLTQEQAVALVGLGGAGKSQLAIEFAYQAQHDIPDIWIFFARAHNESELEKSYIEFATRANLVANDAPLPKTFEAVKRFLESESTGKWLMIIDGVDDHEAFFGPNKYFHLLPQSTQGLKIFTSRDRKLMRKEFILAKEDIIHLTRLEREDAVELVQSRLEKSRDERTDILELVELLDGLPLALSQASSYIATDCQSVEKYLCMYRESEASKIELLSEGGCYRDGSFTNPVAKTWQISFVKIKENNDFAAQLLSFMACLHCQQIPKNLLPKSGRLVKDTTALSVLGSYSMVSTSSDGSTLDMHPLVYLSMRLWLQSEDQFEMYKQLAFDAVYENFPEQFDHKNQLVIGDQLFIHAQTVLETGFSKLRDDRHPSLASRISRYLSARGDYRGAWPYAKKAADWSRTVCGERDSYTLTALNDLVVILWRLGRYTEAEEPCKKVVRLREQVLGAEHKDTLASLNNQGLIEYSLGRYKDAECIHRRVLKAREHCLGPAHNDTLKSLNNLGLSLNMQGKHQEAEEIFSRVLEERKTQFGTDLVGTLNSMNNYGQTLSFNGKHEKALVVLSEAQQLKEIILGHMHPDTVRSKQNLAIVLMNVGRLEESEQMAREVIDGYLGSLGENHFDTLSARSNLAIIFRERGRYQDAKETWKQVLDIQKTQLGENHPETIFSKTQLDDLTELLKKNPDLDRPESDVE